MIIDLAKERRDYFRRWDARDILLPHLPSAPRIGVRQLQELNVQKKVVLATTENNLESILQGRNYQVNHLNTVEKIKSLDREHLLVLPPDYRIPGGDSRRLIAYSHHSLIDLTPYLRYRLDSEEVYEQVFTDLKRRWKDYLNHKFIGFSWTSRMDDLLRVVPFMNDIEGQELRAFQNLAWYQLQFPELEQKIQNLSPEKMMEVSRLVRQFRKYQAHLQSPRREGGVLSDYVPRMKVRRRDLIQATTSFERALLMNFSAPSRSDVYREYDLKICNLPLFEPGSGKIVSQVWDIYGECQCKDKNYRSDRRSRKKEFYFCPHEIAALQGLKAKQEYDGKSERIHSLPFFIPTQNLIDFVDKLRYRTVILEKNPDTGNYRLLSLNRTEIAVLALRKMILEDYHSNATTDFNIFRKQKYDPHLDLIKFR